uniref:Uncharacterized protein n=1 Tax=Cacopsylla melanoneura TaxID=428564 RepID=A0A8D9AV79_9HEMI
MSSMYSCILSLMNVALYDLYFPFSKSSFVRIKMGWSGSLPWLKSFMSSFFSSFLAGSAGAARLGRFPMPLLNLRAIFILLLTLSFFCWFCFGLSCRHLFSSDCSKSSL